MLETAASPLAGFQFTKIGQHTPLQTRFSSPSGEHVELDGPPSRPLTPLSPPEAAQHLPSRPSLLEMLAPSAVTPGVSQDLTRPQLAHPAAQSSALPPKPAEISLGGAARPTGTLSAATSAPLGPGDMNANAPGLTSTIVIRSQPADDAISYIRQTLERLSQEADGIKAAMALQQERGARWTACANAFVKSLDNVLILNEQRVAAIEAKYADCKTELEEARATIKRLETENSELRKQLDEERIRAAERRRNDEARVSEALTRASTALEQVKDWQAQEASIHEKFAEDRQKFEEDRARWEARERDLLTQLQEHQHESQALQAALAEHERIAELEKQRRLEEIEEEKRRILAREPPRRETEEHSVRAITFASSGPRDKSQNLSQTPSSSMSPPISSVPSASCAPPVLSGLVAQSNNSETRGSGTTVSRGNVTGRSRDERSVNTPHLSTESTVSQRGTSSESLPAVKGEEDEESMNLQYPETPSPLVASSPERFRSQKPPVTNLCEEARREQSLEYAPLPQQLDQTVCSNASSVNMPQANPSRAHVSDQVTSRQVVITNMSRPQPLSSAASLGPPSPIARILHPGPPPVSAHRDASLDRRQELTHDSSSVSQVARLNSSRTAPAIYQQDASSTSVCASADRAGRMPPPTTSTRDGGQQRPVQTRIANGDRHVSAPKSPAMARRTTQPSGPRTPPPQSSGVDHWSPGSDPSRWEDPRYSQSGRSKRTRDEAGDSFDDHDNRRPRLDSPPQSRAFHPLPPPIRQSEGHRGAVPDNGSRPHVSCYPNDRDAGPEYDNTAQSGAHYVGLHTEHYRGPQTLPRNGPRTPPYPQVPHPHSPTSEYHPPLPPPISIGRDQHAFGRASPTGNGVPGSPVFFPPAGAPQLDPMVPDSPTVQSGGPLLLRLNMGEHTLPQGKNVNRGRRGGRDHKKGNGPPGRQPHDGRQKPLKDRLSNPQG